MTFRCSTFPFQTVMHDHADHADQDNLNGPNMVKMKWRKLM